MINGSTYQLMGCFTFNQDNKQRQRSVSIILCASLQSLGIQGSFNSAWHVSCVTKRVNATDEINSLLHLAILGGIISAAFLVVKMFLR
jgi:hypothetical protein